jgi:hypothetical protein
MLLSEPTENAKEEGRARGLSAPRVHPIHRNLRSTTKSILRHLTKGESHKVRV